MCVMCPEHITLRLLVIHLSPMFHAVLPSPCPQSLSLLNSPHLKLLLQSLVLFIQHPEIYSCLLFTAFGLSTEHKWAHRMKSYGHSHWLTSCWWREISSEFPLLLPLSCSQSSHLLHLHISEISAQPSLFDTYFISLRCVSEKYKPLLFLSLSKKNNPHRRMCTPSILIHWTVKTYRSENLVKDRRCVLLQVREELPKI